MCSKNKKGKINLDESPYDQDTYWGRARRYFQLANPCNLFVGGDELEENRCLYIKYKCGEPLPKDVTEEDLWRAKALYDSSYNAETGEPIPVLARPAAQLPVNAVLAGGMMAYYKSTPGVVLWQWLNQTYNAFVGYANRGGEVAPTDQQLMTSYALATGTAIGTALALNRLLRNSPPLVGRFVPLAAVAAAHCVSVPLLKAQVLKNGTPIYDDCNAKLGYSKKAAQAGISDAVLYNILYAVPPMVVTPLVMNYLEGRGTLCRYPWLNFPAHVGIAGLCLLLLSPLACAFVREKAPMSYKHLEPELREGLCKKFYDRPPKYVYYNKA